MKYKMLTPKQTSGQYSSLTCGNIPLKLEVKLIGGQRKDREGIMKEKERVPTER